MIHIIDIDSLRLYLEDSRERTWSQRWIQGKASVLRTGKSKTRSSLKDRWARETQCLNERWWNWGEVGCGPALRDETLDFRAESEVHVSQRTPPWVFVFSIFPATRDQWTLDYLNMSCPGRAELDITEPAKGGQRERKWPLVVTGYFESLGFEALTTLLLDLAIWVLSEEPTPCIKELKPS